jgi:hypothetical protein
LALGARDDRRAHRQLDLLAGVEAVHGSGVSPSSRYPVLTSTSASQDSPLRAMIPAVIIVAVNPRRYRDVP